MLKSRLFGLLGLVLMIGCAGGPAGEAEALTAVTAADFEGRILYLAPELSALPMTAEQVAGFEGATPVEIRFHEQFAVAWAAPNGRGRVGDPDSVVGAWLLQDLEDVVLADGEVAPPEDEGEEGVFVAPPEVAVPGFLVLGDDEDEDAEVGFQDPHAPIFYVDWLDDYTYEFMGFWGNHPGCI